jgi:hypothetical protein
VTGLSGKIAGVHAQTIEAPRRDTRRRRRFIVLVVALALVVVFVVLAVRARDGSASSAGSERQLRSGFLEPIAAAGISTEVVEACHYLRRTPGEPWHFSVRIIVAAPQSEVVEALRAKTRVVIHDNGDQQVVQQFPGQPSRGWNGILAPSGSGTRLELVKNNVHTSDTSIGVGWLPVCANSPYSGS